MKKIVLIFSIILMLLLIFIINYFYHSDFNRNREVAVIVNNEKIFLNDIENIYKKYNTDELKSNTITRKSILENGINETLVIQEAFKKGFDISDLEVERRIIELKTHYSSLYEKILKDMNINEFKTLIYKKMVHQKMKDFIYQECMANNEISDGDLYNWYLKQKPDLGGESFENIKEDILKKLTDDKKQEYFNTWTMELRKNADIKYIAGIE